MPCAQKRFGFRLRWVSLASYNIVCYKIAKMWMQVQENAKELKECSKDHLQIVRKAEE